jgi:acyl-CoA thioesterase FadM
MSLVDFEHLHLPRNAFSARDRARAADIWRLLQDAAVMGSVRVGWSPARYRKEGIAFVVRRETVVHHSEIEYGKPLAVRTWVSSFRGGRFSNRQVRVVVDGQVAVAGTQEWIHVASPSMRITRGSADLLQAFALHDLGPDVVIPEVGTPLEGPEHRWAFDCWHTWMDPLAHANHPLYLGWCDEALSQVLAAAGQDPVALKLVAESVQWRVGVEAPQQVEVCTRLVGATSQGDLVCEHEMWVGEVLVANANTVRTTVDGPEPLRAALLRS